MGKSNRVKKSINKNEQSYESDVLSKKEQRKIKKILGKEQKQEEVDEQEADDEDNDDDDGSDIEAIERRLDLDVLAQSDDDDEDEDEESEAEEVEEDPEAEEEEEEDPEAEEEDVPLSEVEMDSDADVVPFTKLTVNNKAAMKEALARIQINWSKYNFDEHQSITYHSKVEEDIKDIYDDTERELQFFKQGLDTAIQGREKLLKLKIPFARPMDYFAEMVKTDEHMENLKSKLIKEQTEKKANQEARRQRELKKFGKQVQNETLQKRQKEKRETLDRISSLKKKRKNNEISGDDFNIAVEEATGPSAGGNKRSKRPQNSGPSSKKPTKKRLGRTRRRNKH